MPKEIKEIRFSEGSNNKRSVEQIPGINDTLRTMDEFPTMANMKAMQGVANQEIVSIVENADDHDNENRYHTAVRED